MHGEPIKSSSVSVRSGRPSTPTSQGPDRDGNRWYFTVFLTYRELQGVYRDVRDMVIIALEDVIEQVRSGPGAIRHPQGQPTTDDLYRIICMMDELRCIEDRRKYEPDGGYTGVWYCGSE